jgi:hypothetical protein
MPALIHAVGSVNEGRIGALAPQNVLSLFFLPESLVVVSRCQTQKSTPSNIIINGTVPQLRV